LVSCHAASLTLFRFPLRSAAIAVTVGTAVTTTAGRVLAAFRRERSVVMYASSLTLPAGPWGFNSATASTQHLGHTSSENERREDWHLFACAFALVAWPTPSRSSDKTSIAPSAATACDPNYDDACILLASDVLCWRFWRRAGLCSWPPASDHRRHRHLWIGSRRRRRDLRAEKALSD
jgi:hypothetical protein